MSELVCCPEWCDQAGEHSETCPAAPMAITKAEFVEAQEAAATHAISAYRIMLDELGEMNDRQRDALDAAESEAMEAAMCRAGIGSCGRGWCEHR